MQNKAVCTISSGVQPLAPGSHQISPTRRNVAQKLTLRSCWTPLYSPQGSMIQARERAHH
jgi:hypothetical protein